MVVGIHAAIFIFLINIRVKPGVDRNEYVSVVWVLRKKPPEVIAPPAAANGVNRRSRRTPITPPSSAPASAGVQSDAQPPIDWDEEAAREADALSGNAITLPQSSAKTPLRPAPNPFAPPPIHHAGDSDTNESGETVVWISDKCYQVSGNMLTVPDVMAHARLPRTLCTGSSNEPRGDLFKDLPAYKKLHPDDDAR
jgi:hypothetical protein